MTFEQLLTQIEKVKGMWLTPLGRARRIKVREVDRTQQRVVIDVEDSSQPSSRTFAELQTLLDALEAEAVVHVDSALGGSGSSRNQPETILANLPGIEYLRIGGRKHLARVSDSTRPYGTTREMDSVAAAALAARVEATSGAPEIGVLLVDGAFVALSRLLATSLAVESRALSDQLIIVGGGSSGILVGSTGIGLPEGTYPMLNRRGGSPSGHLIRILDVSYEVRTIAGKSILLRVERT